jgi:hypothetical protein
MHLQLSDNVQGREEQHVRRKMTRRHRRRVAVVVFLVFAAGTQTPRAQAPSAVSLADVQRLKCSFTLLATGTWENGVPSAEVTKAALSMQFEAIDTQEGTANVADVSTLSAGAPHITVRLLGDNLHFLAMNSSGSVYLTTVFSDRDSRAGGKFKAVHTRHEFTQIRLTSFTSRPEQYYGYCETIK